MDWKRGVVVPIWKEKCDTQDCNNYRKVTLFSVPGEILAQILFDRVRKMLLIHQRTEQSRFYRRSHPGTSCTTERLRSGEF